MANLLSGWGLGTVAWRSWHVNGPSVPNHHRFCRFATGPKFEKSKEEGREEGEAKKQREIAKATKAEGIPASVIVKCTGLPEEQIKAL